MSDQQKLPPDPGARLVPEGQLSVQSSADEKEKAAEVTVNVFDLDPSANMLQTHFELLSKLGLF